MVDVQVLVSASKYLLCLFVVAVVASGRFVLDVFLTCWEDKGTRWKFGSSAPEPNIIPTKYRYGLTETAEDRQSWNYELFGWERGAKCISKQKVFVVVG